MSEIYLITFMVGSNPKPIVQAFLQMSNLLDFVREHELKSYQVSCFDLVDDEQTDSETTDD